LDYFILGLFHPWTISSLDYFILGLFHPCTNGACAVNRAKWGCRTGGGILA
jgi:hypothetical protein